MVEVERPRTHTEIRTSSADLGFGIVEAVPRRGRRERGRRPARGED